MRKNEILAGGIPAVDSCGILAIDDGYKIVVEAGVNTAMEACCYRYVISM